MSGTDAKHPADQVLREFALGRLRESEFEKIEAHVAACSQCADLVAVVPKENDAFLNALQLYRDDTEASVDEIRAQVRADGTGSWHSQPEQYGDTGASIVAGKTVLPKKIGRFEVQRELGKGSFAIVYLARDTELDRDVALKVPRTDLFDRKDDRERFILEARNAAQLDHPGIVRVYDVHLEGDSICIVQQYVAGQDLSSRLEEGPLAPTTIIKMVIRIAEAIGHAHERGFFHRDLKPANVLIDEQGMPHVADFGLALHTSHRRQHRGERAGTCAYMSPEQVRGESHRLDGRSDIWSLGIILYELLVGRPPFIAETLDELFDDIEYSDPQPPRQVNPAIPQELSRICLTCLAKRATDRYAAAVDLIRDLQCWIAQEKPAASVSVSSSDEAANDNAAVQVSAGIVPKGLRSFDATDANFFLQLLPGPFDRDGLPKSIRFWKTRVEQSDPDATFPVGLIYGPSGCGKSSLVKAGLLPRLADHVLPVYVEATPADTEARLRRSLLKKCVEISDSLPLAELVAQLRISGRPEGRKILLVLDQFEQWLHVDRNPYESELVKALRQCDGGRVQCLLLVRGDFWMSITRFMQALEIPLLEGVNSAAVDLFDRDHARKVLVAFGRAYGKLEEPPAELTEQQQTFVRHAIRGLEDEGRVISVRLAVFAEIMKGRTWTKSSLQEVGGTDGVGVTFLEETFAATTAPPTYRRHANAIRAVLGALLPEQGADIKGQMQPYKRLLEVSGYRSRPSEFDAVLDILDMDVRLITPSEREEIDDEHGSSMGTATESKEKQFQLTHDYLVPSLRTWLLRKQKETHRGRAELCLSERSAMWQARPERRSLPSLGEYLRVQLLTHRQTWTVPQRGLMRRATQVLLTQVGIAIALIGVSAITFLSVRSSFLKQRDEVVAERLVDGILAADIGQVPVMLSSLGRYRHLVQEKLRGEMSKYPEDSGARLNASVAMLPVDRSQLEFLRESLLRANPEQMSVIVSALEPYRDSLKEELWSVFQGTNDDADARLRAACALAAFTPQDGRWSYVAQDVVDGLVRQDSLQLRDWTMALQPVNEALIAPLTDVFRDRDDEQSEHRSKATEILAHYLTDRPNKLSRLLLEADPSQFAKLFPQLKGRESDAASVFRKEFDREPTASWNDHPLDKSWITPADTVVRELRDAHGTVEERFAFCQTLPMRKFAPVATALQASGFRPRRCRPFYVDGELLVAAVWTRDGRQWQLEHSLSSEQIQERNIDLTKRGFQLVDITAYADLQQDDHGKEYAALWASVQEDMEQLPTQLTLGVTPADNQLLAGLTRFQPLTICNTVDKQGRTDCSIIWVQSRSRSPDYKWFAGAADEYSSDLYPGYTQADVRIGPAPATTDTRTRYQRLLAMAEAEVSARSDDVKARYRRALANYQLGNDESANRDLTWVIARSPNDSAATGHRAIVRARLGSASEAIEDLERLRELHDESMEFARVAAIVATHLGEEDKGIELVEATLAKRSNYQGCRYAAARAYAVASSTTGDEGRQERYAKRAVALLQTALKSGSATFRQVQSEPDFDGIREVADFLKLMSQADPSFYSAVWHAQEEFVSRGLQSLAPADHLGQSLNLIAEGYRPVVFSLMQAAPGEESVGASVWDRPFSPVADHEMMALRQANAAVAMVRLGYPEEVWSRLAQAESPSLRGYLAHRLSLLGADPAVLVRQLHRETNVAIRRVLLLALGDFSPNQLITDSREQLSEWLCELYRNDPDPGIRSAVEWLLRRWQFDTRLSEFDTQLAKHASPDVIRHSGDVGNRTSTDPRRWYVNSQGQTLVIISAKKPFLMGSATGETGRRRDETLHGRYLQRTFAISSKQVTVRQFLRFRPGFSHHQMDVYPDDDCPVGGVTWYEATAYCNWLSEQEGIPKQEWCYIPNKEGEYAEGMKIADGYLGRRGYRLPTEAEWEYSCRAGNSTTYSFGESDALLPQYAWYFANSKRRSWPAGRLKPNDFGLFDMHGNLYDWSQDAYVGYRSFPSIQLDTGGTAARVVIDDVARVLRGGCFYNLSSKLRCAQRANDSPSQRILAAGFRVVKTCQ